MSAISTNGILASKYANKQTTTTTSFTPSNKSWADLCEEDSEESTHTDQESTESDSDSNTSSPKQPEGKKPCAGMLQSRWADPNYKPSSSSKSTNNWDAPNHYGSESPTDNNTTKKQPVGMLKSRWAPTEPQTTTTTTTKKQPVGMLKSRWAPTEPTTTNNNNNNNTETSKQPAASTKPSAGMLKSKWADPTYECKGAQTRAEYRATHSTNNSRRSH